MRSIAMVLTLAFVLSTNVATAQRVVSYRPVIQNTYVQPTQSYTISQPQPVYQQRSYQTTSYRPSSYTATSGTSNVFTMLNSQRTRMGAPALGYDPTLQAVAQRRAQQMAAMGLKNHPPGSFSPGKYEGVGWSSSYSPDGVKACFINDYRMRYAGAAMARGRDGVYFAVVYR